MKRVLPQRVMTGYLPIMGNRIYKSYGYEDGYSAHIYCSTQIKPLQPAIPNALLIVYSTIPTSYSIPFSSSRVYSVCESPRSFSFVLASPPRSILAPACASLQFDEKGLLSPAVRLKMILPLLIVSFHPPEQMPSSEAAPVIRWAEE